MMAVFAEFAEIRFAGANQIFTMATITADAMRNTLHKFMSDLAAIAPQDEVNLDGGEILMAVKRVIEVTLRTQVVGCVKCESCAGVDVIVLSFTSCEDEC